MSRISETFESLRRRGERAFIPFVTAGDPDLETSLAMIETLADGGANIIELGVPFSDPMADGPTIQASSQRALANGVAMNDVLRMVARFRARYQTPIVLFGYLNPILQFGIERFRSEAAASGVDGVLVTDMVDDEAAVMSDLLCERDVDLISLVAPTTSEERLEKIAERARGFIYAVSRAGVTGARADLSNDAELLVKRVRAHTDRAVAVGFGISTRTQLEDVWKYADGAVVGSAIVAEIAAASDGKDALKRVSVFVSGLLPQVAKTQPGI